MKHKLLAILLMTLSDMCLAGDALIGPIYVESLTAFGIPIASHVAGNIEVKVRGGFALPSGISCDNLYITTLRTSDSELRMFSLLAAAQRTQKPIFAFITDNPTYTAFPGRCSFGAVALNP